MTWRVVITQSALADAAEVRDWIARDSPAAADAWIEGLLSEIDTLERFPRRFRVAPEQRVFRGEIRQMLYHSHRVIYHVEAPAIRILHIRHAARLPIHRNP